MIISVELCWNRLERFQSDMLSFLPFTTSAIYQIQKREEAVS